MAFDSMKQDNDITVEELESKKQLLLIEIHKLGKTKEDLDLTVSKHDANNAKYADLSKAIDNKQSIIDLLNPDITSLTNKKLSLQNECNSIQTTLNEKKDLISEVDKLKSMIKILQKEYSDFNDEFTLKRNTAESKLSATTEKLRFLYASLGSVLNQVNQ